MVIHTYIHTYGDLGCWEQNMQNHRCLCAPRLQYRTQGKAKHDNYIPLVDQLQKLYPNFKYQVIPVVVGTLGALSTSIKENLKKIGIKEENIQPTIEKIQKLALLDTLKITKNFQKM